MLSSLFILPLVVSSILAYIITPYVIKIAWKYNFLDDPKEKHPKKLHKSTTPRAGGLAIFIAFLISTVLFLPMDQHLIAIIAGASALVLIGLLDDKYVIHPLIRLGLQFLAAGIPIAAGIGIAFISNPLSGGVIDLSYPRIELSLFGQARSIWILSDLFALFWLVFVMNVLNMGAKGVPGQLPGITIIAAVILAVLSLKFSADIAEWPVVVIAAVTAGSFLGFLPYNMHPQKIMPAFSGSMLAGYLLGLISILTTAKVGLLLVLISVPVVDVGYAFTRRIISGRMPFWGDRGHLHHKLLDIGLSYNQVSLFYWLTSGILGIVALNLTSEYKFYTIIGIILLITGLLIWLTYRKTR